MDRFFLITDRVLMRPWRAEDREPFFAINSEPAVYRHLGQLTRERSDGMIDRANANFAERGWGRWALQERQSGQLIGHCGFMPTPPELQVQADAEIGWRISERCQGRGYAREAAEIALRHGFSVLGFDRIVAYTTPANEPSWRLMERLGMGLIGEFDHPAFPDGHRFRRHVLYELRG